MRVLNAAIPPGRLREKRYFSSSLLVIDEIGFRPLDQSGGAGPSGFMDDVPRGDECDVPA